MRVVASGDRAFPIGSSRSAGFAP